MFEKFVQEKIEYENGIVQDLGEISRESIVKSKLSEFTKGFLLQDLSGNTDTEALLAKIEKSNKLYFNFTIRPKWTLLTYLFNNFESRPPKEILDKLNTFPFYKFYADSISDFLSDNIQIFTTKNEIMSVIDETNKAIYDKLTTDITNQKIKNFFLQIFKLKYEDESAYNLESTIPYSFVKIFLKDKSYTDLEKKFHAIKDLTDGSEISLKDIIKALTDKFLQKEKTENKIIEPVIPTLGQSLKTTSPELKQKKEELKVESKSPALKQKKEELKVESKTIYSEDLLKAAEEEEVIDTVAMPDDKVKNISELFNDQLTQKITSKVYGSDLIYRERSFEKLSHYKTWFEASKHLREIFQINRVEIYDKDVTKFVDVLNEYFKRME